VQRLEDRGEDARLGIPAAKLGLGYRASSLKNLVDIIGPAFAREVLITGRQFKAEEAKAMGFVHRVVRSRSSRRSCSSTARLISENAPLTIRASKRIFARVAETPARPLDAAACAALVKQCFESQDYVEGRRAFMEKRKPVFQGKISAAKEEKDHESHHCARRSARHRGERGGAELSEPTESPSSSASRRAAGLTPWPASCRGSSASISADHHRREPRRRRRNDRRRRGGRANPDGLHDPPRHYRGPRRRTAPQLEAAVQPLRDFAPISMATVSGNVLVVHPSLPAKTSPST